MALDREKGVVHNINRIVIALLTIIASGMDGLNLQDLLFTVALLLWLWLPECDRIEATLLAHFKERKNKSAK